MDVTGNANEHECMILGIIINKFGGFERFLEFKRVKIDWKEKKNCLYWQREDKKKFLQTLQIRNWKRQELKSENVAPSHVKLSQ